MIAQTHSNFGIAFGLSSLYLMDTIGEVTFSPVISIAYLYFVHKGSRIPDIDHPGSTIGRQHRILSWIVSKLFGHRKFTHSVFFILLLCVVNFVGSYIGLLLVGDLINELLGFNVFSWIKLSPMMTSLFLSFGLGLGMFSHVVGDSFTKNGVRVLSPFSQKKFKLPFNFKTGGSFEKGLSKLLLIFNLGLTAVIAYNYYLTI